MRRKLACLGTAAWVMLIAAQAAAQTAPTDQASSARPRVGNAREGDAPAGLGRLLGHASAGDGTHVSAPDPEGRGLALAVRNAMAEGGVTAGDITWSNLIKPYGHTHPSGRKHGPFSESSVIRAVANGVDPDGNDLLIAMPRYKLSPEEMADLIAYLKRIDTDLDPGLTDTTVTVGLVLPSSGGLAEVGAAMKDVVAAYFDSINTRVSDRNERISRAACRPVLRGIPTSRMQRSGRMASACSTASTPSDASATTCRSACRSNSSLIPDRTIP